jgi:hypothetical protein
MEGNMKNFLVAEAMKKFMIEAWKICRWIWIAVIVVIFTGYIGNVLVNGSSTYVTNLLNANLIPWLFLHFTLASVIIDCCIVLFLLLSCISVVYFYKYPESDPTESLAKSIVGFTKLYEDTLQTYEITLKGKLDDMGKIIDVLLIDYNKTLQTIATTLANYDKTLQTINDTLQTTSSFYATTLANHDKTLQAINDTLQAATSSYTTTLAKREQHLLDLQRDILVRPIEQITNELTTFSQRLQDIETQLKQQHTQDNGRETT